MNGLNDLNGVRAFGRYAGRDEYSMSRHRLIALAASIMVTLAVLAPLTLGAALAGTNGGGAGNTPLSIGVSQGADRVTVAVTNTSTGSPVAGANVSIESDGNYAATGETAAGGIAAFDAPNATVNATITAATNASTVSTRVTLEGSEGSGPAFVPFGQQVSAYVQSLQSANGSGDPMGLLVAAFAGGDRGPPDHAGPPAHAGPPEDRAGEEANGERSAAGPPEDVGPDSANEAATADGEPGPPDHAGPPEDAGPPSDAGPGSDEDDESEGEN